MPMQPASANASACTGDGPAWPALSSTIDASPERPGEHEIVFPDQFERGRRLHAVHCSPALRYARRPMRFAARSVIVVLVLLAGCADHAAPSASPSRATGDWPITEASVRAHLEFLASDALNGRQSGTRDEQIAAEYVGAQFRRLGLGAARGATASFVQTIPYTRTRGTAGAVRNDLQRRRDPAGQRSVWRSDPDLGAPRSPRPPGNRPGGRQDLQRRRRRRVGDRGGDGAGGGAGEARTPKRTIIFACFGSEEVGGFGATHLRGCRRCRSTRSWRTCSSR